MLDGSAGESSCLWGVLAFFWRFSFGGIKNRLSERCFGCSSGLASRNEGLFFEHLRRDLTEFMDGEWLGKIGKVVLLEEALSIDVHCIPSDKDDLFC